MKPWIIVGAVALVVAGAAGAFFVLRDDTPEQQSSSQSASDKPDEISGVRSINSLLAGGSSVKCTYNVTNESGQNNGIAYFSGDKKMYGEFTNTQNGQTTKAHVIRNGDTQYVWQQDSKEGYKANVSQSTEQTQKEKSAELDPDKEYEFKCSSWQKNEAVFNPPSDIQFNDISASIEAGQDAINKAKEACAAITDPAAKAACESAL